MSNSRCFFCKSRNLSLYIKTRCVPGVLSVLAVFLAIVALFARRSTPAAIPWAKPEWMERDPSKMLPICQSTLFQPFRVGCPATCERNANTNEPMYRMNAAWYFGQGGTRIPPEELPTAYDKGINYQASPILVENFLAASNRLEQVAKERLPSNLTFKPQKRLHMSLAYLCCLRRNETDWVREILYEWVAEQRPFDFTVQFDRLQCWHERHNSITNIIVADEATQKTVMRMVHSLYDKMKQQYHIPLSFESLRENQMPIHMTLAGLHYEGDNDDIRPVIPAVHQVISELDQVYGGSWTGSGPMRVTHDPKHSAKGVWHAGPRPKK